MITTANEYYSALAQIQDNNFPVYATLIPSNERIYEIDLGSRKVSVPEFISVETDHKSETIYFKVDRFFDYMDLSTAACVIEYINAKGESHYYPVPYYDVLTYFEEGKMIIPWVIDGAATIAAGSVKFSIRFYKIDGDHFIYNLSTLPTTGKVLHGLKGQFKPSEDYEIAASNYEKIVAEMASLKELVRNNLLYWIEV